MRGAFHITSSAEDHGTAGRCFTGSGVAAAPCGQGARQASLRPLSRAGPAGEGVVFLLPLSIAAGGLRLPPRCLRSSHDAAMRSKTSVGPPARRGGAQR